ncbi:hypothetical protein FH508_0017280 [Lysinibacillus sp. CD3-6]|uniref:hypothetical protein n=1 Tax=Lysinibacillus sp. CD3-6 TaxID=2892541 RepID=UPI00116883CA|nr:hypothetical protein [Lysinibacillus sp. CD3-6]UED79189.1 hypothetical protein FH508_0017280 [Lysinibacillus sp. CD3-6]
MVQYYYDKFTAIGTTVYTDSSPWESENGGAEIPNGNFIGLSKSSSFNPSTNTYALGIDKWGIEATKQGDVAYAMNVGKLFKSVVVRSGYWTDTGVSYWLYSKTPTKNSSNTTFAKGVQVQSAIAAEEGTYPANGRHTDGYWYVKGEKVNTAPTQPGAFTQPSGILKIGESKVFSVGAASDADENLSKYIWEVSLNGAAYSKAGETATPSFTYTIPTATSLKMRIKAVDTAGLESAYRESNSYTVQPVNTAPTTPGAFTQPSGTLEIGDAKVFSVGAASDAEGNFSKYSWEVSINGAAYSKSGETATPSFTYTIPTATSLRMRVKAVDSAGLESAYRESSSYSVQPPQYYYDKFITVSNTLSVDNAPWELQHNGYQYSNAFAFGSKGYSFESGNNRYTTSSTQWQTDDIVNAGDARYYLESGNLRKWSAVSGGRAGNPITYETYEKQVKNNGYNTTYSRGSLIQSGISAGASTYPANGRHTDSYWYVRGSRVSQSIAPPAPFTAPTQGKIFKPNEVASIIFGASTAPNLSLYEVDYRYNSIGTWTSIAYNNTLTRSFTTTTDKALKTLELRVRAKNTSNVYSDYVYSEPFEIEHNVAPTITLTGPEDNATLYENDILNIAGTAFDADADQSVTVYYQINSEARKILATNLSQIQISLSKQITFKGGKIYDGETALTGTLAAGVAHTLKVWAEDSEKALSAIVERTFYVVPNRAPLLSVDAVVPSGVVDADKFKISGTATDQDVNSTLKVTSRINAGNAVEIYSGSGGAWEFDLALSQLVVGQNTIVIEVIDNYGAKTSKTVTLNKKELKTPILQSVARYKIEPPKGSAKGVLLFIQRDEALDIKVELSMTASDEQEQYETLTPVNTAPVQQGLVEDTFEYEGLEAKQNIILKITPSRTDLALNHKIHLISGAVD